MREPCWTRNCRTKPMTGSERCGYCSTAPTTASWPGTAACRRGPTRWPSGATRTTRCCCRWSITTKRVTPPTRRRCSAGALSPAWSNRSRRANRWKPWPPRCNGAAGSIRATWPACWPRRNRKCCRPWPKRDRFSWTRPMANGRPRTTTCRATSRPSCGRPWPPATSSAATSPHSKGCSQKTWHRRPSNRAWARCGFRRWTSRPSSSRCWS